MMRQHYHFLLSLLVLFFTHSWCLNAVLAKEADNNNVGKKNLPADDAAADVAKQAKAIVNAIDPADMEAIAKQINAATKISGEGSLRSRLQSHVEAQVSMMLSGKQNLPGDSSSLGTHKIELKIDLPADLAALVNNGSGAFKFQSTIHPVVGDLDESKVLTLSGSTSSSGSNDNNNNVVVRSSTSSSATLCPVGKYSDTGFDSVDFECEPCPEGQSTVSLGGVGVASCEVTTEDDLLAMFYDMVNGDSWSESQRRGWQSRDLQSRDLPVCEWEGVSCNSNGEVNGFAFPIIGMKNNAF